MQTPSASPLTFEVFPDIYGRYHWDLVIESATRRHRVAKSARTYLSYEECEREIVLIQGCLAAIRRL
jgi:hypothetical protein